MKIKTFIFCATFFIPIYISYGQLSDDFIWQNPSNNTLFVIEGSGWPKEVESTYDRLPKESKKNVRESVWYLSKQSAGLLIRFKSDSPEIKVEYQVNGEYNMPHMPTTGVSGIDLYAKNSDGKFLWFKGNYSFKDTIRYHFKNLNSQEILIDKNREYQLYLPLYNNISWLKIGISKGSSFKPISINKDKPIVVYGTSITQGACASRPGMAWTSLLKRKMDRPLINLGFSGNGKLEIELIDIINSIDANIYILDCLPNLELNKERKAEDVYQRIITSVKTLRKKHPLTPILLVDHGGHSDGLTDKNRYKTYNELNELNHKAYQELLSEGLKNIYMLTKDEINLGMEDYVDGDHPTDIGMMKYALAMEKKINLIFHE